MDLMDENGRYDYARRTERKGPMKPTPDHLTLLRRSSWDWNDCFTEPPSVRAANLGGGGV